MTVSKKEIIEKLNNLGYKANSKNTNTSLLEKGYVLVYTNENENGFIKVSAEELGYKDYKTYSGYGYHGGGRPRKDAEARRVTISISGTPTEINELKKRAADAGLNVSRFVLDNLTK